MIVGNETVRLAGMGNIRVGIAHQSGGLFGNPATPVVGNNLSLQIGVANQLRQRLPPKMGFQFRDQLNLDLLPSFYYARPIGQYAIHLGFVGQLENQAQMGLESTRSEYAINEQRFIAKTNLVSSYDLLWQYGWQIGVSHRLSSSNLGGRVKAITQRAKEGQILSSLHLNAQHGSDINVNDPRALIPAIIDSLDFTNPAQYLERTDEPLVDLIVTKYDFDFGYQHYFSVQQTDDLCVGVVVENLLQRKLVRPLFTQFGIGAGYRPQAWILVGADLFRGNRQFTFNSGIEIRTEWEKIFRGAVALRAGVTKSTATALSLGGQISLGSSVWNYAFQQSVITDSVESAPTQHLFGSMIRF